MTARKDGRFEDDMNEQKETKLEWSRWCPFPKVGMRVEYVVNDDGGVRVGVSEGTGFRSDRGVRTEGANIGSWRPETVVVKARMA